MTETDYYYDTVRIVRLKTKNPTSSLVFTSDLFKTLQTLHPDVVFHHDVVFSTLFPTARYVRKSMVPFFVDNHADEINFSSNRLWRFVFHKVLNRLACRLVDSRVSKYYGVSPMRCEFLKKYYRIKPSRIELLPIGADVVEAESIDTVPVLRRKYRFREDDLIIASGGKMGVDKGTDRLIAAVDNTGYKLILFGSFSDEETRLAAEASDNVTVFGWCSRQKTLELLKLSDLACWPIHHTTLIEDAVSVCTPILVRNTGNTSHLMKGNGLFCTGKGLRSDMDTFFSAEKPEIEAAAITVRDEISYRTLAQRVISEIKSHSRC